MAEEKDEKPMVIRRQVEQIVEFPIEITLENVEINSTNYDLKLINERGRLTLEFYNKDKDNMLDYRTIIDGDGFSFDRLFYIVHSSPNLRDGGMESLQERVDDSRPGSKKGEILWRERFPYQGDGYDFFHVEFGARREDY